MSRNSLKKFNCDVIKEKLINIFNESQYLKNSKKCRDEFMKIYATMFSTENFEKFMMEFIRIIKNILLFDSVTPYTKRTLDFIALILREMIIFEENCEKKRIDELIERDMQKNNSTDDNIDTNNDDDDDLDDEIGNECFDADQTIIDSRYLPQPSYTDLFIRNYLLKFIQVDNLTIRRNSVSLLKKIIDSLDEIDESTFNEIVKTLTVRCFDKDKIVRALIMLCLQKLQDVNENDNVSRILKLHLQYDPDSFVRSCSMKVISLTSSTLKTIYESTNDISVTTRRLAFIRIAENSSASNFEINDRLKLLINGFTDPSIHIRNIVLKKLIPNWISDMDNDIVRFLDHLDIRNINNLNILNNLFDSYFQSLLKIIDKNDLTKFHQLLFQFKEKYFDQQTCLPSLNQIPKQECIYLWYRLCLFCKQNNITYKKFIDDNDDDDDNGDGDNNNDDDLNNNNNKKKQATIMTKNYIIQDLLDDILPDIPIYCNYIENFTINIIKFIDENNNQNENENGINLKKFIIQLQEFDFIFKNLINIGIIYNINDLAQWNCIEQTFRKIILNDELYTIFNDYIELIYKIFNNYYKNDWKKLLDISLDLINTINLPELQWTQTQSTTDNDNQIIIPSSQLNPQERIELDDKILERCINICNSFLQVCIVEQFINNNNNNNNNNVDDDDDNEIELLTNVRSLINKLILKNLAHSNSERIRLLSIKALGNYCFLSISTINYFLKIFIEIINENNMYESRIISLKCLFDYLIIYGTKKIKFIDFTNNTNNNDDSIKSLFTNNTTNMIDENFFNHFLQILNEFLNEPSIIPNNYNIINKLSNVKRKSTMKKSTIIEYELFNLTVRGLCKLLIIGRFLSPDYLSKLIIIYTCYKNIDIELKQFIREFIYNYSENIDIYLKQFKLMDSPFNDAYLECFHYLLTKLDDDNNNRLLR